VDGMTDASSILIGGNLNAAYVRGEVSQSAIQVLGNVNAMLLLGGVEDSGLAAGGNLGVAQVIGDFSGSGLDVNGNLNLFMTTGSVRNWSGIGVGGSTNSIMVLGALVESDVWTAQGINMLLVRGDVGDVVIDVSDYDVSGDPTGGGIRTVYVLGDIVYSDIWTQSDIGLIMVRGDIRADSYISTLAFDNYGWGSVVGGGGINYLMAKGLLDSTVESFGNMNFVMLGVDGLDATSWLGTDSSGTGDLLRMYTTGLVFGEIYAAGDVGSILTAGQNALPGTPPIDYLFVDALGVPTGGTLEVAGSITGLIS